MNGRSNPCSKRWTHHNSAGIREIVHVRASSSGVACGRWPNKETSVFERVQTVRWRS